MRKYRVLNERTSSRCTENRGGRNTERDINTEKRTEAEKKHALSSCYYYYMNIPEVKLVSAATRHLFEASLTKCNNSYKQRPDCL